MQQLTGLRIEQGATNSTVTAFILVQLLLLVFGIVLKHVSILLQYNTALCWYKNDAFNL